ncbi:MAG TPA: F0F1 ATP synthase subunit delta [Gemmatirosa sp.]|nr:F0F1 ATP synthase subunit delta [Gemmatirosa sp.]
MRDATIARNYADALLTLARKAEDPHGWGRMLMEVADAVERDDRLRLFLEAPRITAEAKNAVLGRAFQDRYPRLLVRYLQTLVTKRRQMLLPLIATEYFSLLDEAEGRVHAQVTLALAPSDADRANLAVQLSRVLGKTVIPHVTVNPAILGGVVVKVGDTVIDGSVRRRLGKLRQQLLATRI